MHKKRCKSEVGGYRPTAEQILQYSRRDFLKLSALAAGGAFGSLSLPGLGILPSAWGAPAAERIVRVHCGTVQDWDFSSQEFWNHVNLPVMHDMFARGICALTGRTNVNDAWHDLLVGYEPGHKVAMKLNLNSYDHYANQTCEMAYTIIESLKDFGVSAENIKVFDVVRRFPPYWRERWDSDAGYVNKDNAVWDSNASIYFPHSDVTHRIPTVFSQADHLINICLLKGHGSFLTGSMKNHYGSQEKPVELHGSPRYDNMATLTASGHVQGKTRLIVVEGSYMTWENEFDVFSECVATDLFPAGPSGHASPNFMMFGTNYVSMDSVLGDLMNHERAARGEISWSNPFIEKAAEAPYNLGPREVGQVVPTPDSWSEVDLSYNTLDYISFDLPPADRKQIDALNLKLKNGEISWRQLQHLVERYYLQL